MILGHYVSLYQSSTLSKRRGYNTVNYMEETKIEAVDSVTTHEEETVTDAQATIAELREQLKTKSIETRLAKKEKKEPKVDDSLLERVTRMELKENGLKDADEISLVTEKAKELGIDPLKLVKGGYADTILKEHRQSKADALANPSTQSRGGVNKTDSVAFWIAKGELPPTTEVELRRKVVKAKIAKQSQKNMFNYEID